MKRRFTLPAILFFLVFPLHPVTAAEAASAMIDAATPAMIDAAAPATVDAADGGAGSIPGSKTPILSEPYWVIPSEGLPSEVELQPSNCNVAIAWFEERLFMAWRTAPAHFASPYTRMYVVSSADYGVSWEYETEIFLETDLREPYLISFKGNLILTFFEAGSHPLAFEPVRMWRCFRTGFGEWSELETWGEPEEVPWAYQVHKGRLWLTSYLGEHYSGGDIDVRFHVSDDGFDWEPAGGGDPVVYTGGVSEVGFEFDSGGNLWGVTRLEDGDDTGFGSHVVTAPAGDLSAWEFPSKADPERYDSPRMFRHGEDIYLIARRDPLGPYDRGWDNLPPLVKKLAYLAIYSLTPKKTALYRIDTDARKVEWILDLPSAGDTSFPSILRIGRDSFLVANYTSPLRFEHRSWLAGQISPRGTRIYLIRIDFAP